MMAWVSVHPVVELTVGELRALTDHRLRPVAIHVPDTALLEPVLCGVCSTPLAAVGRSAR